MIFFTVVTWEQRKLNDLVTMHARIGWQGLRKSEFLSSGDYYIITGTDFVNNEINLRNISYIGKNRYDQDKNIQVHSNDILLTKDGTIGKVAYVDSLDKPATLNAGVYNIRNKSKELDTRYLFHYLTTNKLLNYAKRSATGGTIKHLNQNILVNFPVEVSSKGEEIKISNILDKIDKQIFLQQRKNKYLKVLEKALLQNSLTLNTEPVLRFKFFYGTWKKHQLEDFGSVEMNKRIFKAQTNNIGGIPFYKIGTFGKKADSFISKQLFKKYKSEYPFPKKGDLLISASGSIGRVIEYKGEDAYFQDSNIVWLNHDDRLLNSFLKPYYKIIRWKGTEGSTIKRLYNKNILSTNISVPNLKEQEKVGSLFNSVDNLLLENKNKLSKYYSIKQFLLHNLFI